MALHLSCCAAVVDDDDGFSKEDQHTRNKANCFQDKLEDMTPAMMDDGELLLLWITLQVFIWNST